MFGHPYQGGAYFRSGRTNVKVSRRLGLTVQAATHISALGNLTVDGQAPADVIAYVSRLGVAVVLR